MLGYNMFAYCLNNPIMMSDYTGDSPEWWQWAISGTAVVAGIALTATGIGGALGGALICAGANSIISSYVTEASGGCSVAGWCSGAVTGLVSGFGASYAGALYQAATESVGGACLTNLAKGGAVAFGSGFAGTMLGEVTYCTISGGNFSPVDVAISASLNGALTCVSGIGSAMSSALFNLPVTTTTTQFTASIISTSCAVATEMICDTIGTVANLFK